MTKNNKNQSIDTEQRGEKIFPLEGSKWDSGEEE
jgi:hypothetical protein